MLLLLVYRRYQGAEVHAAQVQHSSKLYDYIQENK